MSIEDNKAVLHRVYDEIINQGNFDVIPELVSEDVVEHEQFPGLPTTGHEAVRAAIGMFRESFSDLRFTVDDMIAEGDKVAARITVTGTHTGQFMGMPPTNKNVEVQAIDILEIHDGKITAHWGQTDQGAMMEQLGMAPEM